MTQRELVMTRSAAPADRETSGDPSATASQLGANPLAFHGDVLVQWASDGLWRWDAAAMRRVDAYSLNPAAFALQSDGAIAAYVEREEDCAIHRLDASGTMRTFATMLRGSTTRHPPLLLRAATPDTIYAVRDDELALFRLAGVDLEQLESIPLPARNAANRAQMFSLDDGRVVTPGDGIHVLAAGAPARTVPTGDRIPRHLARAGADRLWYSHATAATWRMHRLVLASLEAPALELRAVDLAPARIVHLASHGAAVALLLVGSDTQWIVAVIDETGDERWRVEVPAAFATRELNTRGAVAVSATRVVLRGRKDRLLAWDASTGVPIPVTMPT